MAYRFVPNSRKRLSQEEMVGEILSEVGRIDNEGHVVGKPEAAFRLYLRGRASLDQLAALGRLDGDGLSMSELIDLANLLGGCPVIYAEVARMIKEGTPELV